MGSKLVTCLLIYTFILLNNISSIDNSTTSSRCKPYERSALLNFKHNLTYLDKNVSSSWKGEDCCEWSRVGCDNTTGHILKLDLNGDGVNYLLKMKKLESLVYLLELKNLESLDLSFNNFSYSSIPSFIGSMKQLRYLYLSSTALSGLIPSELGNLANLQVLVLSGNELLGKIPASLGKLSNLKNLNLMKNNLSSIASSLIFPSNLEILDLSFNQLSGEIPTSLGKLSMLVTLDISYNHRLNDTVLREGHLANLSSIKSLAIEGTFLKLDLSSDWVPPFQLESFSADNCKINGQLPPWLQTQKTLSYLSLVDANITGHMPNWFRTMQQLEFVLLSNNQLSGSPIFPPNISTINLSNNSLSGDFLSNQSQTKIFHNAKFIHLSHNFISGPFLEGFGRIMPNLEFLFLSNNQISGPIPNSLCQITSLTILDIQNNSLSGMIPNCWANVSSLQFLGLSYNKLQGHVPCFDGGDSSQLSYLQLSDNKLSGEIPLCLNNLANLQVLDIGGNELSGKMPKGFNAQNMKELKILRLRGNEFSGTIPNQICFLPRLQLIDLGHNNFTGFIPRCLSKLRAMTSPNASMNWDLSDVSEVVQGVEYAYTRTLPFLVDIDLSCNNMVGSIPDDITKLPGLLSLNLSYNQLSGTIPGIIGELKSLISLDLSMNKLRGRIPTSMNELYSLSHLNMSYNNLSGQIPTGNQLQTLSNQASIYAGNPYLCADFLPNKCKSKPDNQYEGSMSNNEGNGDKEKKLRKMGFDLVVMSGFATGFWGVVGCLVINRRWRYAFFQRLEDGYNWLYVIVTLKVRAIKAKTNRR